MNAPIALNFADAMLVPVDPGPVAELVARLDLGGGGIGEIRPKWNSDLVWLSAANAQQFDLFEQAFEALGVADHVRDRLDLAERPHLYSGFLLRRSRCELPDFHTDWRQCDGQAFTFITAVSDARDGFGLLYRDADGRIASYDYRPDQGIMFGDDFSHSTRPGVSEQPVTLLCFEFGSDKMRYWKQIYSCIAGQSVLVKRPDGKLMPSLPPPWSRWRSRIARRLPRLARWVKARVR